MADAENNIDDLEDGEIESDGEDPVETQNVEKEEDTVLPEKNTQENNESQDYYFSKSGKKKKSKNKGDQKYKDRSKKSRKYSSPTEDDFAGTIEKAIRKAMNKNDDADSHAEDNGEDRRKHKKRKKYDSKDGPSKKRKKQEYTDEMDENEMMCVRGASPVQKSIDSSFAEDDRDSYASDSSHESRGQQHHRTQRHRPPQRERNRMSKNERRRAAHQGHDSDGLCLYYMQGKCHKGDDCIYSHDAQLPRKMELCKFYMMDCCAKRDKCLYMHADFPCKYYHTGLPCIYKDECKFAHGKPLSESLKNILLKHIESAPKEILGDFPRLHREGALQMIQTTQMKLLQQFSEHSEEEKSIPSLFELNISNPQNLNENIQSNQFNNDNRQNKNSPKVRQSRWQNDNSNQNFNVTMSPNANSGNTNILSIKNLTGVLTPRQILDLTKMGIENLDQLGQLTVLQLNSIGISLKQITEIQLNTMNIQKLGLINANNESPPQSFVGSTSGTKDLDLRIPPAAPVSSNLVVSSDLPGKDVDMRFQQTGTASVPEDVSNSNTALKKEQQTNKDMIDIDQYTKDALKFASKDKENIDVSNESFENEKPVISVETKDVDHRVLPFPDDNLRVLKTNTEDNPGKKEFDTDIRFLQPEPLFKPEKRHRRSTTDDEDNLLIDEKWYSSDEEKGNKKKSPASSPRPTSLSPQTPAPHVIEPSSVLSRLGDLSKIDISEEVTKLLNTMKNNLNEKKVESALEPIMSPKSRDPRSRRSPEKVQDNKIVNKKPQRISIYECIDGEPTDGRRRTDVDLRQTEYKIPTFGDTDLRQSASGDIDFRLGLPFKPINNYTPATEINGSISSHPPMAYKLVPIDIPRPDYTDIRDSTAKSQALVDPRLRKVFRLSIEESNSDSEKSVKITPVTPRVDPRRKPKDTVEIVNSDQKSNVLEIQNILQNSNWYKELSSTHKIFVNQHLAPVSQMVKQYQQEKSSGKKFDLAFLQNNSILCNIFTSLGVSLGENGEFTYLPKPKEALLQTPANFNQNANTFTMNSNIPIPPTNMDTSNMNMMNMPPMGLGGMNNINVGPMHGFNQPVPDPRSGPTPGLLGIAPNIPHNFNNKFGGPNNFGNMGFNGPGNDFNFMDGEQNFPRFPNRGGHRGRGNDRWNRGGSGRGQRDRKNFNDRSSWKNDRH
ncbi:protein suppressor of sable isoform X2 [Achroia grisella]|nr:protein suppressor of sable isoform X2 [Achroia grisella]XP_059052878.1 protein suppressor of sable isoform X2 [Achroia grisella]XP_059052879.1 protein suppressor of sable isoform X2 [Achroia grisella]